MFNWNKFPYTNFHELNLDWFIQKFQEIFDEWSTLYQTMIEWKADTDQDLADWKRDTLAALDQWEDDLIDALDLWKQTTGQDITDWEDGVIGDLNSWKSTFEDDYEALATRVQAIVSDVEDMVENLAAPFSSSTAYLTGDYVVQNGVLYRFTADHAAGAWTGSDAVQVTAMADIDDLSYDQTVDEFISNSGIYAITKNELETGIWRLGNKQAYSTRGRCKRLIPVKAGMRLVFEVGSFDVFWGVATARTWTGYAQGGTNGTWVTAAGTHSVLITVDGFLVVLVRNHADPSSDVDLSTFSQTCEIASDLNFRSMTFFDASSLVSFGVGDMPANSFTYGALATTFSDCPDGIASDAYISIRKESQNSPSVPTIYKITVRDVINEVTYEATYRGGASPLLWAWRQLLTDRDRPVTNLRTCNIFKKVLCVGDSYTEGYINTTGTGAAHKEYSWPTYMEQITGNDWINCGVSGATTMSWLSSSDGLAAAQAAGRVQAYIVQLMINDYSQGMTVGTIADITSDSPTTFYGYYAKIIRELHEISADAVIFVCTCPYLADKPAFQTAVREIAAAYASSYNVHLLDFKSDQRLFRNTSLTGDLINYHYTAAGYEQMAEIYAWYISDYIDHHIADFQSVYAIPYDT